MSIQEPDIKVKELRELQAMIEATAQIEAIKDSIKLKNGGRRNGSPSGGRLESHLAHRHQQPPGQQGIEGRPSRSGSPVQQGHQHHPFHPGMKKAPCASPGKVIAQEAQ